MAVAKGATYRSSCLMSEKLTDFSWESEIVRVLLRRCAVNVAVAQND